jgi:Mn2+/Fe2+ NRAMP family transporter
MFVEKIGPCFNGGHTRPSNHLLMLSAYIYQLLIFSQVMLAMQLEAAVISLFRVASSISIMGTHKISPYLKVLA